MPLKLSIAAGDYLMTSSSFNGHQTGVELISNVTLAVVAGQNVYTVTVPSGVYKCGPNNTVVREKLLNGINTYVLTV